jgi:hypothetical protein
MSITDRDDVELEQPPARNGRRWPTAAIIAVATMVALAAVAVVVSRGQGSPRGTSRVITVPALQAVSSAVGTTLAAQRWDMTFADSFQPAPGSAPVASSSISGHGTTNLDPFAMVAVANVAGFGQVTTMMSGSLIWEFGAGNYGISPGSAVAPWAPIAGFAPLVEGTLGPEDGAVSMLGLGSSTGYLHVVQSAITAAAKTGTGVVDGAPVTLYRVSVDPTKLTGAPGVTPGEAAAVADALRLLAQDGFQSMTDTVAVDAAGRIRQTDEVVTFADGAVATLHTTLSNFDCAPTVVLPGAPEPTVPGPCGTPPVTAP